MKKPVKIAKRNRTQRKTTKNAIKKPVKPPQKRKKLRFSDGLRAFLLAGIIAAFSAGVSFVIITINFTLNREDTAVLRDTPRTAAGGQNQPPPPTLPREAANPQGSNSEALRHETTVPVQPSQNHSPSAVDSNSSGTPPVNTVPAVSRNPPNRPDVNLGTLIFVIDDAGNNLRELEPFLRIPEPLTIAVLPGLPYSAEAARRIRAAGKEVILHQPMEAIGAQNPGPGAIYSGMDADEIRAVLSRNVAEIGPIAGINNHQGSKITMDREAVQTILAFCAEHDLYFLDSRTTAETIVPFVAQQMGVRIAERNVFIDNEQNRNAMFRYIEGGLTRAQRNGSAVMIGHTWSPDLAPLLAEQFPLLTSQGYTIKTASDIIK